MKTKFLVGAIFLFSIFGIFLIYFSFYCSLFRFNTKSLKKYLDLPNKTICVTFSGCDLHPGDILARRYMTDRTRMITHLTNVYFNHTAFYMGSGMIFEAVGTEKDSDNDIVIHLLRETDWIDKEVEQLLIIRPQYTPSQLSKIQKDLEQIAQDPEYRFGIPLFGEKKVYCSEVIYRELIGVGIIKDPHSKFLVTPDKLMLESNIY